MFLHKNLIKATTVVSRASQRGYFSVFDKIRDRFNIPMRHLQSFTEPDGYNYQSQMPDGYRIHGNTAASFSASVTQNTIELH